MLTGGREEGKGRELYFDGNNIMDASSIYVVCSPFVASSFASTFACEFQKLFVMATFLKNNRVEYNPQLVWKERE